MAKDDFFVVAYKMLRFLEAAMKVDEIPIEQFVGESFGISEPYFREILKLLSDDEYIKGISFVPIIGQSGYGLRFTRPEITIKGLEYLQENSMMKKAANIAKGIIDVLG